MSSRARRVALPGEVAPFAWGAPLPPSVVEPLIPGSGPTPPPPAAQRPHEEDRAADPSSDAEDADPAQQHQARLAALERDAFAKGYAAGERAGAEAGAKRAEAMLRRLAGTLDELAKLRQTMVHQTEHQMVQLAMAVARRIVGREIALDGDLIVAMARVALERLGEGTPAVVRLNPEDLAAIGQSWAGPHVQVVADQAVSRGGCLVESEFGVIDASVEAQFDQIAQAMLGDGAAAPERVVPLRRAS